MSDIAKDMYSTKIEISKLKEMTSELNQKKLELELEMQRLNNRIRTNGRKRMPDDEYKGICKKQMQTRLLISAVEQARAPITAELREWYAIEDELRIKAAISPSIEHPLDYEHSIREKITSLRNTYLSFAEDGTRVNSMRLIASQVANELTIILQNDQIKERYVREKSI